MFPSEILKSRPLMSGPRTVYNGVTFYWRLTQWPRFRVKYFLVCRARCTIGLTEAVGSKMSKR